LKEELSGRKSWFPWQLFKKIFKRFEFDDKGFVQALQEISFVEPWIGRL
jgi:hypothetical protein